MGVAQPDIKAAVLRDFEFNAGLIRKEKEAGKTKKEKAKTDAQADKQKVKGEKWSGDIWAAWKKAKRAKQAVAKGEAKTDSPEENRRRNRIRNNSRCA